jgi:hypothetical protein
MGISYAGAGKDIKDCRDDKDIRDMKVIRRFR